MKFDRKEQKNTLQELPAYSHLLALKVGLGEDVAENLKLALPLHDVGKLGIPDAILHKTVTINGGGVRNLSNSSNHRI